MRSQAQSVSMTNHKLLGNWDSTKPEARKQMSGRYTGQCREEFGCGANHGIAQSVTKSWQNQLFATHRIGSTFDKSSIAERPNGSVLAVSRTQPGEWINAGTPLHLVANAKETIAAQSTPDMPVTVTSCSNSCAKTTFRAYCPRSVFSVTQYHGFSRIFGTVRILGRALLIIEAFQGC